MGPFGSLPADSRRGAFRAPLQSGWERLHAPQGPCCLFGPPESIQQPEFAAFRPVFESGSQGRVDPRRVTRSSASDSDPAPAPLPGSRRTPRGRSGQHRRPGQPWRRVSPASSRSPPPSSTTPVRPPQRPRRRLPPSRREAAPRCAGSAAGRPARRRLHLPVSPGSTNVVRSTSDSGPMGCSRLLLPLWRPSSPNNRVSSSVS